MPRSAPRRCTGSQCRNLVTDPHYHRCYHCERKRQKEVNARRTRVDYGKGWREISKQYLLDHPLCEECLKQGRHTPAKHTDHVVPRRDGGSNHPSNLRGLCIPHHSRFTVLFEGGFGNKKKSP